MAGTLQQHREIVERSNVPLQFDSVHQEDRDGRLVLAEVIEEDVLNVLCLFAHDAPSTFGDGGCTAGIGGIGGGSIRASASSVSAMAEAETRSWRTSASSSGGNKFGNFRSRSGPSAPMPEHTDGFRGESGAGHHVGKFPTSTRDRRKPGVPPRVFADRVNQAPYLRTETHIHEKVHEETS
jgi:hypothetical protein